MLLSPCYFLHRVTVSAPIRALRSWVNAVLQNRGVCGQAFPSPLLPSPLVSLFCSTLYWTGGLTYKQMPGRNKPRVRIFRHFFAPSSKVSEVALIFFSNYRQQIWLKLLIRTNFSRLPLGCVFKDTDASILPGDTVNSPGFPLFTGDSAYIVEARK